jgi:hypothetical protein
LCYAGVAIKGDLDAEIFNHMASATSKWSIFKVALFSNGLGLFLAFLLGFHGNVIVFLADVTVVTKHVLY